MLSPELALYSCSVLLREDVNSLCGLCQAIWCQVFKARSLRTGELVAMKQMKIEGSEWSSVFFFADSQKAPAMLHTVMLRKMECPALPFERLHS